MPSSQPTLIEYGAWGPKIDGASAGDNYGHSVALSSDAMVVAAGAYLGAGTGYVLAFRYDTLTSTWIQMGGTLLGEGSGDQFGISVALSSDGRIIAAGGRYNDNSYTNAGHIRVYEYCVAEDKWDQLGGNLNGKGPDDRFGQATALSSDGSIVAGSALSNSGYVRIFQFSRLLNTWIQLGLDINPPENDAFFGHGLALSSGGFRVAAGSVQSNSNGFNSGRIDVFEFDSVTSTWSNMGAPINGEAAEDQFGFIVSLSSDGLVVAGGGYLNDGRGTNAGHVRVFEYDGDSQQWNILGGDINGVAANDNAGISVDLSSDGMTAAVGAALNDGNGSNAGHVRIFHFNRLSDKWDQIGEELQGDAAGDYFGRSVSLSSDGTVVACGAPGGDTTVGVDSGYIGVFGLGVPPTLSPSTAMSPSQAPSFVSLGHVDQLDGLACADPRFHINTNPMNDSDLGQLISNGDDTCFLRLVPMGRSFVASTAFLPLRLSETFEFEIQVSLRRNGGGTLSEGLAIVLHQDPKGTQVIGDVGGYLGVYGALSSIRNALIVEIDGVNNGEVLLDSIGNDNAEDVADDAVHVLKTSSAGLAQEIAEAGPFNIRTNEVDPYQVWIEYCAGQLKVFLSASEMKPSFASVDVAEDLSSLFFGGVVFFGFGAASGSTGDTVDVTGFRVQSSCSTMIPTQAPSLQPSQTPSSAPSAGPTFVPSLVPTQVLTLRPSFSQFEAWGQAFDSGEAGANFGASVALSAAGTIMAVGATFSSNRGQVFVYQFDGATSNWMQLGNGLLGEGSGDGFGFSVALSASGTTVAAGARLNDGNGLNSGHVRVFQYDSVLDDWNQLGSDMNGEAPEDFFGLAVALSAEGTVVAVGAERNHGVHGISSGHVRVLEYDAEAGSWTQVGLDIDGEASGDFSGVSVDLSSDGSTVAIGALYNDGNGSNAGHCRVFKFDVDSQAWSQMGGDLDGTASNDQFGWRVSLSSDGTVVAVAGRGNDDNGPDSGHVRIYEYTMGTWQQLGSDIQGQSSFDLAGFSLDLSGDGRIAVVGAHQNDKFGTDSGQVRVFAFDSHTSDWNQLQEFNGLNSNDLFGYSVGISSDGMTVAAGAVVADTASGVDAGYVRVYSRLDPPTVSPTLMIPSSSPTLLNKSPSSSPSGFPTLLPSALPSLALSTLRPSAVPSTFPSLAPFPSRSPSSAPTTNPSFVPSYFPSSRPSNSRSLINRLGGFACDQEKSVFAESSGGYMTRSALVLVPDSNPPVCYIELTKKHQSLAQGTAFTPFRFAGDEIAFSLKVIYRIYDSSNGADGMAIVMHQDPRKTAAFGGNAGSLSVYATGTIVNALVIEIDSARNTGLGDIGSADMLHVVRTESDGSLVSMDEVAGLSDIRTSNSPDYMGYLWADYCPGNILRVYYNTAEDEKPNSPTIQLQYDISQIFSNTEDYDAHEVIFGFAAANGGIFTDNHEVMGFYLSSSCESGFPSSVPSVSPSSRPSNTRTLIDRMDGFDCDQEDSVFGESNGGYMTDSALVPFSDSSPSVCLLELTRRLERNAVGTAFTPFEFLDNDVSFSLKVAYRIYGSSDGADGLAIVMHQDPRMGRAVGGHAGGLAVYGANPIVNALVIEIDTTKDTNYGDVGPANSLHVVRTESDGSLVSLNEVSNLGDILTSNSPDYTGYLWADYCAGNRLTVYYNSAADEKPDNPSIDVVVDVSQIFTNMVDYGPNQVMFGFAAATRYWETENQEVRGFYLSSKCEDFQPSSVPSNSPSI